jgi:hypothetical protein
VSSGLGDIGKAFVNTFNFLLVAFIVMVPLAVWKLIDIAIWIYKHFSISIMKG